MAARSTRLLLIVAALGVLLIVAVGVAAVLLADGAALPSEPRWLHLRAGSQISDAPVNQGLLADPNLQPPLTTELSQAIRDASSDAEVAGLFLEVESLDLGYAQLQELARAIEDFQASGKPCVAWASALTTKEYLLASACHDITLAPAGMILVPGMAITQTYYAGTFEKVGVTANFEHVGDFKSAIEPYQRSGPSEPAMEAMNTLLDSLYSQTLQAIATGRRIPVDEARALVEDPPMTPRGALERGMVDHLAPRYETMAPLCGEEDPECEDLLTMRDYLQDRRQAWATGDRQVAVIYAEGAIVDGEGGDGLFGGSNIGDKSLRKLIDQVREDDDVVAVVLRINSPGGSGSASDAIWQDLKRLQETKPLVVSMGDYAASGGYYIAAGARWIVAEPGTLTGSIGVFGGKLNLAGLLGKVGMTTYTYQRGPYANLFSGMSDFNELERARFRDFLLEFYETFLGRVSEGRKLSRDEAHAVAQGRVWTGEQALDRKLVDQLGGVEEAIVKACELADVPRDEIGLVRLPQRKGFLEQVLSEMENPSNAQIVAPAPLDEALRDAITVQRVLEQGGVAAMLPGRLELR